MAAPPRRATRPARFRAALFDFIKTGNEEFFDMIDVIKDNTERKQIAQAALLVHYYGDEWEELQSMLDEELNDVFQIDMRERYSQLFAFFALRFGQDFFADPLGSKVTNQFQATGPWTKITPYRPETESIEWFLEPGAAGEKYNSIISGVFREQKEKLLRDADRIPFTKSAKFSRAALIRQALIEAKGDPHAAAKIVMAGPKRDKKEKKGKKEKLRGVGKKDGSFEMPVSKYGNITEPVWYINKKPKVAKQATKTNSTITVPGATKPMPVYSVVNIAMKDGNGHGRTWGFFYDDANERVIISFARPQYDTDANVAGLVKFIESRLGMVSTTTDLYYKYFRDRGIVIPLATAAPSRSSLSSVYGWDADHLRNMTKDPFDEGNFEDLDGVYSRSDEEE
jgi:hypothetical protein